MRGGLGGGRWAPNGVCVCMFVYTGLRMVGYWAAEVISGSCSVKAFGVEVMTVSRVSSLPRVNA